MRKLITLALVAAGSTGLFAQINLNAQFDGATNKATTTATVQIFAPVKLKAIWAANFGKILLNNMSAPASIELVSGDRTGTFANAHNCAPLAGVAVIPAHFDLWKDKLIDVSINVGPAVTLGAGVVFTPKLGTIRMEDNGIYTQMNGTEVRHFDVGGKLDMAAGVNGTFTAPFTVTATYN